MLSVVAVLAILLVSSCDGSQNDMTMEEVIRFEQIQQSKKVKFSQYSVDEESIRVSERVQEVQAKLAQARARKNRRQFPLLNVSSTVESRFWYVPCNDTFYKEEAYGAVKGCTPSGKCKRAVRDNFMSDEDMEELLFDIRMAFRLIPRHGSKTMLNPSISREVLNPKAQLIFEIFERKARLQIMRDFGCDNLFFSGSLIAQIQANPVPNEGIELPAEHDYWAPHIDKANVPTYDYSALLYLSTMGTDFDDGEFAFLDEDGDRYIEPKKGRLIMFSSGAENFHQVRKVSSGNRVVISCWYTCSKEHQFNLVEMEKMISLMMAAEEEQNKAASSNDDSDIEVEEEEPTPKKPSKATTETGSSNSRSSKTSTPPTKSAPTNTEKPPSKPTPAKGAPSNAPSKPPVAEKSPKTTLDPSPPAWFQAVPMDDEDE